MPIEDKITFLTSKSILAVDDSKANLKLLVQVLSEQGFVVRPMLDGISALASAQAEMPDLILLDVKMPNIDGYEVCKRLKANEQTRDIPVIFISAQIEVFDKIKAFEVGAVDYVTKPIQTEELLARVQTHLKIHNLTLELQNTNQKLSLSLKTLKATQEELVQSEKMAALGQLIAGIAHEINTPLGAINSSIQNVTQALEGIIKQLFSLVGILGPNELDTLLNLVESIDLDNPLSTREKRSLKRSFKSYLEEQVADADLATSRLLDIGVDSLENLEPFLPFLQNTHSKAILDLAYYLSSQKLGTKTIITAVKRASKVVFALKSYTHKDHTGQKLLTDIRKGIDIVLTLHQNLLKKGVEVTKQYQDVPELLCYPDELNQVWTNLIYNALQAMDYKGQLIVSITQEADYIVVAITDSGKGIPEEVKDKIFEPFFTTKASGEGSGLGLDIVQNIVHKHQGNISFTSKPGKTTFRITLPLTVAELLNVDKIV